MTYPNATHVSPHLTWAELACRDGSVYPTEWRASRALPLSREFEAIRALCDHRPIVVASAFRTSAYNRRVGGARNSQHMHGRALDLLPPVGMRLQKFLGLILDCAAHQGSRIRGVGVYPTFIHIDIRDSDRLVRWGGSRPQAEAA